MAARFFWLKKVRIRVNYVFLLLHFIVIVYSIVSVDSTAMKVRIVDIVSEDRIVFALSLI